MVGFEKELYKVLGTGVGSSRHLEHTPSSTNSSAKKIYQGFIDFPVARVKGHQFVASTMPAKAEAFARMS